ncbi:MAG: amidohydrolase [Proteobacteria bacterium]|nr:amidohydrolase [Pseudomonadota bacterium]
MLNSSTGICFIAWFVVAGCDGSPGSVAGQAADRVFLNGAVYTVDAKRSWAEAVAVNGGLITFVGSTDDVQSWIGENTDVTELDGQMLLPGFHDSHTHLLIGVPTEENCDLLRLEPREAVEARLAECTALEGFGDHHWIIGGGWGEWLWPNGDPGKALLDRLYPDRPVYLDSSFGHSAWVNSRALELAGINDATTVGSDGIIVRDSATGEATGTLHDSAIMIVRSVMPEMTMEYRLESVRAAIAMAHALGVTAVIEPGIDEGYIAPLLELSDAGNFDLRALVSLSPINMQPGAFDDGVYEFLQGREKWRRPNIDVDSVKIFLDGIIESGMGALLEPYEDAALGLGPRFYPQDKIDEYFTRFDAMGLQVHVHAIGDAAVRMALDGFEVMRNANGMSDNRHHITHLQLIADEDVPRFAQLDIGATFQALWAYADPAFIELDVPMIGEERTAQMYPIGDVHRSGGRINGASDYWVTDMNPLLAIEVAMTRQNPYSNDGPPLDADQRMDLETMIEAYTINGAYTMSLEDQQGSIEVGKRADFVVLDYNLFDLAPQDISEASVTMTIFDGRTVYQVTE